MDFNEYFHLGTPMKLEAANEDTINIKNLTSGQKSKRVPSYRWINTMLNDSYNPDKLNYTDYNEMLRDPQIKAAERLITYSLLSKDIMVTPASEDPQDVEVADFVRDVISNMSTPFRQVRKDLYTAIPYGFSVSECNFIFTEWEQKARIIIDSIYSIHIKTIWDKCFEYDDYGNVKNIKQTIDGEVIPIPPEKCIIFAFDEMFGNKYGRSILRACYDDHFMKHQILIWAAVFLEKHEGPTVVGYESETAGSNAEQMQENIDSIHDGTAGFIGKYGEKYEILESSHRGEAFMQFINYHDNMIFRSFMIGSLLLGQAENQGGSYSQSQTHADTLSIFLDGVHNDLANSIQERVKTLVDLNFNVTKYPRFGFEPFTQKDLLGLLAALQPYADKFMIDTSSSWFHQLLKRIMDEYADIEITDEEETTGNVEPAIPEPGINEPLPTEQTELITNIQDMFPNQTTGT